MPDKRKHRGPHPQDAWLFRKSQYGRLRQAVAELSWLLTRGYAERSGLKLVGDRHALFDRQRLAVMRCACSDQACAQRKSKMIAHTQLAERHLVIDGYNVLTTVEAALAGGVLLVGYDGCIRDLASVHGSFRKVSETVPAIELIGETLSLWRVGRTSWLFDQPVSNSGRLKQLVNGLSAARGWNWSVQLVPSPDALLRRTDEPVATADGPVLDACRHWVNLAREIIERSAPDARVIPLAPDSMCGV